MLLSDYMVKYSPTDTAASIAARRVQSCHTTTTAPASIVQPYIM